jgi:hypothetical protein
MANEKGNIMKKLLERLFCKHDYIVTGSHMENGGMCKVIEYKCKKCGKVKWSIV